MSWNVLYVRKREYALLNGSLTAVRCSSSSFPDIPALLSKLEELNVPSSYSRGLREIYFTRHLGGKHRRVGDYVDGVLRVVSNADMIKTLVHELAHHVDDMEGVTADGSLEKERRTRWRYMPDSYCKRDDGEYLAVGFEVFYAGDPWERREMGRRNPLLYRTVRNIHRRFLKR